MTAGWQPDPLGRHELRYWDGSRWTEHVSDRGTQAVDPVEGGTDAAVTAAMQPSSSRVLWEGQRESLGAAATKGRMVSARYRLTEDALHFEAGLLSTRAELVPLWTVMDVDLQQSMTQKARGVGDLIVRLDTAGARLGQPQVTLESIKAPREVRDLLTRQANVMRRNMLDHQHAKEVERRQAGASSITIGTPQVAPTAPSPFVSGPTGNSGPDAPQPNVIEQLKELAALREAGILTDEEFAAQKAKLLG